MLDVLGRKYTVIPGLAKRRGLGCVNSLLALPGCSIANSQKQAFFPISVFSDSVNQIICYCTLAWVYHTTSAEIWKYRGKDSFSTHISWFVTKVKTSVVTLTFWLRSQRRHRDSSACPSANPWRPLGTLVVDDGTNRRVLSGRSRSNPFHGGAPSRTRSPFRAIWEEVDSVFFVRLEWSHWRQYRVSHLLLIPNSMSIDPRSKRTWDTMFSECQIYNWAQCEGCVNPTNFYNKLNIFPVISFFPGLD